MKHLFLVITACWICMGKLVAAPFSIEHLNAAEAKLEEQNARLIIAHEKDMGTIHASYEKRLTALEGVLRKRGDLENLLKLREATKAWKVSGQIPTVKSSSEPMLERVFRDWRNTQLQKERALQGNTRRLQKSYASQLLNIKRQLTISENIPLAVEADKRYKAALAKLEDRNFGAYADTEIIIADLSTCQCILWNNTKKFWKIHPLSALNTKLSGSELQLSFGREIDYNIVKVFLPIPLRPGDIVTIEAKGVRSIAMIDTSHADRCAFYRTQTKDPFTVYTVHVNDGTDLTFQKQDEVVEHKHYQRRPSGTPPPKIPFDITGFYPGMSFYRNADLVIRKITIERPRRR